MGVCHTLRYHGVDYATPLGQLTFLLFLKMAEESAVGRSEAMQTGKSVVPLPSFVRGEKREPSSFGLGHSNFVIPPPSRR